MQNIIIDISSIIQFVILLYIVFNLFTLIINKKIIKINITNVFNPFRDYKKKFLIIYIFVIIICLLITYLLNTFINHLCECNYIIKW